MSVSEAVIDSAAVTAAATANTDLHRSLPSTSPYDARLARLHRFMVEPSSYSPSGCAIGFSSRLHCGPTRRVNSQPQSHTTTGGHTRESPSASPSPPNSAAPQRQPSTGGAASASSSSSLTGLSYSAEQSLLHDCLTFLTVLTRAMRMPVKVMAEAAVSIHQYCALFPMQRQPFILAPIPVEEPVATQSNPELSVAFLSNTPPLSLYALATTALFLASKSHDTPRRLNDFVDAHIAIVTSIQRIRRSCEKEIAKFKKQSIERVKLVWREFHARSNEAVEQHLTQAQTETQSYTPPKATASTNPYQSSSIAFNPLTLQFPSSASSFVPSHEWTTLRATIVYIEFILLTHVTEFAFNGVLTSLEDEGIEATLFTTVQKLVVELVEPLHVTPLNTDGHQALAFPPADVATRFSRLAWILTHAAMRGPALVHSNAHVVAIAVVFLTAQRFKPQPAQTNLAGCTAMDVDTHADMVDLNSLAAGAGWSPRFVVLSSPSDPTTPQWFHALCPTLSFTLLLTLAELIIEAAISMPMPPDSNRDGTKSDSMQAAIDDIADQHPWALTTDTATHVPIFHWPNAPTIIRSDANDTPVPYEEPFPRHRSAMRPDEYQPEVIEPPEIPHPHKRSSKRPRESHRAKSRTADVAPVPPPASVAPVASDSAVGGESSGPSSTRLESKAASQSETPNKPKSPQRRENSQTENRYQRDRSRSREAKRDRDTDRTRDRYRDYDRSRDRDRRRDRDRDHPSFRGPPPPLAPVAPIPVTVPATPLPPATQPARAARSRWGTPPAADAVIPIIHDAHTNATSATQTHAHAQPSTPATAHAPIHPSQGQSHPPALLSRRDLSDDHKPAWQKLGPLAFPPTPTPPAAGVTAPPASSTPVDASKAGSSEQKAKDEIRRQGATDAQPATHENQPARYISPVKAHPPYGSAPHADRDPRDRHDRDRDPRRYRSRSRSRSRSRYYPDRSRRIDRRSRSPSPPRSYRDGRVAPPSGRSTRDRSRSPQRTYDRRDRERERERHAKPHVVMRQRF